VGAEAVFFVAVFLTGTLFFAAFAVAAFLAGAFLGAAAFTGADFAASARFRAQRFLVAAMIAFRPAALNFRLGFENSSGAFGVALDCFTGGLFGVPEDACKLTASFARVTATLAF
jgi:hypothetical protein